MAATATMSAPSTHFTIPNIQSASPCGTAAPPSATPSGSRKRRRRGTSSSHPSGDTIYAPWQRPLSASHPLSALPEGAATAATADDDDNDDKTAATGEATSLVNSELPVRKRRRLDSASPPTRSRVSIADPRPTPYESTDEDWRYDADTICDDDDSSYPTKMPTTVSAPIPAPAPIPKLGLYLPVAPSPVTLPAIAPIVPASSNPSNACDYANWCALKRQFAHAVALSECG
jgi:hypothetical protein